MRGESAETMALLIHIADLSRVSELLLHAAVIRPFTGDRSVKTPNAVQFIQIRRIGLAMAIETTKLTIRLPVEDVDFVKCYAKANGLSVTEVIYRYLRRARLLDSEAPPAALDEITGLLPADMDAEAEMRERRSIKRGRQSSLI